MYLSHLAGLALHPRSLRYAVFRLCFGWRSHTQIANSGACRCAIQCILCNTQQRSNKPPPNPLSTLQISHGEWPRIEEFFDWRLHTRSHKSVAHSSGSRFAMNRAKHSKCFRFDKLICIAYPISHRTEETYSIILRDCDTNSQINRQMEEKRWKTDRDSGENQRSIVQIVDIWFATHWRTDESPTSSTIHMDTDDGA